MVNNKRLKRVEAQLQKEIYNAINKIVVPKFPGTLVSVMSVIASESIDMAKVYLSFFSLNNRYSKEEVFNEVVKSSSAIRNMVAHNIVLKFMPELKFLIDTTLENSKKLEQTLSKINKKEE